jgi:hypothetical protein
MLKLQRECLVVCVCVKSQGPTQNVCVDMSYLCLVTERDRATLQNQDMIAMLQDLRQHQSTERAARIDDLLAIVSCTHNNTEMLAD